MKQKILIAILLFSVCFLYADDTIAKTEDGRTVILHENGSWSLLNDDVSLPADFDLRRVKWGMSEEEVRNSESFEWTAGELDEYTEYIYTKMDFLGEDSLFAYFINADRLYQARYVITEKHTNKTDYWDAFKRIVEALKGKYGETLPGYSGRPIWKDDLYKDDPNDWGMAIATGKMVSAASWETDRSEIDVSISGDNFDISLAVNFYAKDFKMIEGEKVDAF